MSPIHFQTILIKAQQDAFALRTYTSIKKASKNQFLKSNWKQITHHEENSEDLITNETGRIRDKNQKNVNIVRKNQTILLKNATSSVEFAKIKPIGQKIAKRKKHISLTTHACLPVGTILMTGLLTALAMLISSRIYPIYLILKTRIKPSR